MTGKDLMCQIQNAPFPPSASGGDCEEGRTGAGRCGPLCALVCCKSATFFWNAPLLALWTDDS